MGVVKPSTGVLVYWENEMKSATQYDVLGAIMAYEQGELGDDATVELFQHLIDTGTAWQMQGSYGRMAIALIEQGKCKSPWPAMPRAWA